MQLRDSFVYFTPLAFYGNGTRTCEDAFDGDVAGRGVVSSLIVTAALTTVLAMCAPFLDGIAGYGLADGRDGCEGVFPHRVNHWLFARSSPKRRDHSHFLRQVLTRVMITLGDQQILTGIAILISGYVRALQFDAPPGEEGAWYRWRYRLVENHFFLVVYLACLSSSSHLAAVVTLKRHLVAHHQALAFLRLALIALFALLLTATICLAVPFGPPTVWFLALDAKLQADEALCSAAWQPGYGSCRDVKGYRVLMALFYMVAVGAVLYPYWIAIVNTFEGWNDELGRHFRTFWQMESRWLPMHWIRTAFAALDRLGPGTLWKTLRNGLKRAFLFLALGRSGEAYCLQVLFFAVSLFYVLLQRVSDKPHDDTEICDLSSGGTKWSFGQILPMILLAAPVITAITSYFEIKTEMEKEKQRESDGEKPLTPEQIA